MTWLVFFPPIMLSYFLLYNSIPEFMRKPSMLTVKWFKQCKIFEILLSKIRAYRKWQTLETGRYNAKSGGHFSYLRVKIVNFDHSLTCTLFGTHQKCDIYRTFFRFYRRKLGIPIDRVPTSESCVFCLGIKFLFFPIWPFLGPFLL